MIARTWHGCVRAEEAEEYYGYLQRTALPDIRAAEGNRGVYVLRRRGGKHAHFVIVSLWRARANIRSFAGDDPERALYYPEDARYLLELEPHVKHYRVLSGSELFSVRAPRVRP